MPGCHRKTVAFCNRSTDSTSSVKRQWQELKIKTDKNNKMLHGRQGFLWRQELRPPLWRLSFLPATFRQYPSTCPPLATDQLDRFASLTWHCVRTTSQDLISVICKLLANLVIVFADARRNFTGHERQGSAIARHANTKRNAKNASSHWSETVNLWLQ